MIKISIFEFESYLFLTGKLFESFEYEITISQNLSSYQIFDATSFIGLL